MRILILEDNETLANGLAKTLTSVGYAVDVLSDGEDGESVLEYQDYDLLLLDLGLPGIDGIDILKKIRNQQKKIPVIIISARDRLDQKILGFETGADDYLCKPFDLEEVVVRVHALLRRTKQDGKTIITLNDLTYDTTARILSRDDERIELSFRELSVFEYLLNNCDQVLSKDKIADHISSFDDDFNAVTIETYISRLRKKLGDSFALKTVRGLGYILNTK